MTKGRLEAFSDGVIAILITIMVLELRVPHGATWEALRPLAPVFLSYVLSFVFVGIYWNNHHHLLHAAPAPTAGIMWANMHLLFWLSLIPFATGWMGENHAAALPVAIYGGVMTGAAIAYTILVVTIVRADRGRSHLDAAFGSDLKGKLSLASYAASVPLAFVLRWVSVGIFVAVALVWLIPDRRLERHLHAEP
ncbi:MAG TPA: TMEM175 family protein [Kofleriaceae bacterium]|nr:TMEM175 family protein [Kofleriaceae bacterium]